MYVYTYVRVHVRNLIACMKVQDCMCICMRGRGSILCWSLIFAVVFHNNYIIIIVIIIIIIIHVHTLLLYYIYNYASKLRNFNLYIIPCDIIMYVHVSYLYALGLNLVNEVNIAVAYNNMSVRTYTCTTVEQHGCMPC